MALSGSHVVTIKPGGATLPFAATSPLAATLRPGSSPTSKSAFLSTAGRTLLKAQSVGSFGNTQHQTQKGTLALQTESGGSAWSTKWRPAPAHLVDEWHSLKATAKGAVTRVRDDLQRGEVQAFLSNCGLGDAGAFLIAEVFRTARLRMVNLYGNNMGDAGALRLTEVLEPMSELQVVCLSCNCIGDVGAAHIAKLVERHGAIKLVSLDRNKIGDPGAAHLVTALSKNPRGNIEVNLAHNPVRRFGPRALEGLARVAESVALLAQRGVTLGTLLRIYTDGVADGSIRPRQTSTGEVVQKLLLPACEVAMKSYVDVVTPGNPPPMTQVIHAWDALFEDLVRAVASHACGQRSVEVLDPSHHQWCYSPEWTSKSYFLDAFCVNQHAHVNVRAYREFSRFATDLPRRPTFALGEPNCQVDRLDLVAHKITQRGGRLLVVVDTGNRLLTRVHCLHELHRAIEDGLPTDVIFSGVRVLPKSGRGELVQVAEASVVETKQMILDSIQASPGGFNGFNQVVLDFIDRHVDREFNAVLDQFESKPSH